MDAFERLYRRDRLVLLVIGIIGLAAFVVGLGTAPQRAWGSLMVGNLFFVFIAAGATVFVAWTYVFEAGWPVLFRRVPEAMSAYLPIGVVILVATFVFGGAYLYPWMQPAVVAADPHLQHRRAVLNPTVWLAVTVVSFALWIGFSNVLRGRSRRQDADGGVAWTRTSLRIAAAFLVIFGVSLIVTSFEWLMSMEPGWTSTMFPVYALAVLLTLSTAAITLAVIVLARRGTLTGVNDSHVYELARLLVSCSTFWVYIWFCQYMLIYYTNIPEEAVYYAARAKGPWSALFLLNPTVNWVLPTVVLLTERARRSFRVVAWTCVLVLAGQWLAFVLMVMPALKAPLHLGVLEVLVPAGLLPLFALPFLAVFRGASPVPERDPYLAESVELSV